MTEATTPTGTHRTEVTADPDLPMVHITREFDAPPEKVFRAHVDPQLITRWLSPHRLEMQLDHWDCRTGGSYRYVHSAEGEAHGFHGCFHEVRPNELIVQTFTYEGVPDGVSLEWLRLEPLPGGRTRLSADSIVDSFEARDAMISSGMEGGLSEAYDKLDALLAR